MGWCDKPAKASAVADAKCGDEKVGAVVKTCPLQQGNLTKVEWVNGGATGSEATIASCHDYDDWGASVVMRYRGACGWCARVVVGWQTK